MSTLLKGKSATKAEPDAAAALAKIIGSRGYLPQVNLLPPSITAKRALQRLKRWLVIILIAVVTLAIGLYAWAALDAQSAQDVLRTAEAENTQLQNEQAKYAEVPRILKQIRLIDDAKVVGMGQEIAWAPYIDAVNRALPKGAELTSMNVSMASPIDVAPTPGDPLQTQGIGTVTLVHHSTTVPDTADWLESLDSIPGFTSALYSTAQSSDDEGATYYDVTTTVQLTDEALSKRFLTTEEAK